MGRSIFSTIMSEIQQLDRQIPTPVALVGTYGSGKTHLLSALASFLFAQVWLFANTSCTFNDSFGRENE
jgi:DNA replication protein DnaC